MIHEWTDLRKGGLSGFMIPLRCMDRGSFSYGSREQALHGNASTGVRASDHMLHS